MQYKRNGIYYGRFADGFELIFRKVRYKEFKDWTTHDSVLLAAGDQRADVSVYLGGNFRNRNDFAEVREISVEELPLYVWMSLSPEFMEVMNGRLAEASV